MAWVETLKTPHGKYCVLSVSKHSEPSKVPTQLKQEQNVWHDYGTQDDPHSYTKLPEAIYCYISFTNSFRNLPLSHSLLPATLLTLWIALYRMLNSGWPSPQGIWQCLDTLLVIKTGEWVPLALVSTEMLLHILQCTAQPSTTKKHLTSNVKCQYRQGWETLVYK